MFQYLCTYPYTTSKCIEMNTKREKSMFIRTYLLIPCLLIFLISCTQNKQGNRERSEIEADTTIAEKGIANKATFFIDNSGGMNGYVNEKSAGKNGFKLAITDLAQNPKFQVDRVSRDFNFVNGPKKLVVTNLGSEASSLTNSLNPESFNVGNVSGNDLNAMLQLALSHAGSDSLSIFVSDAIYDIQDKKDPLTSLQVESRETSSHFIDRLIEENIQTLVIKLESYFAGTYFYGIKDGGIRLTQNRPYYVFAFGTSNLLTKYFDNKFITNLDGYVDHTRFFISDDYDVSYAPSTVYKKIGDFRPSLEDQSRLEDVETDRDGIFQFSVGVDYSEIPLSDKYLQNAYHYEISDNFRLEGVQKVNGSIFHSITEIEPTHLLTLRANSIPIGEVTIRLKNESPEWIKESHNENDVDIVDDSQTTFGLFYLLNGIIEAYNNRSKQSYYSENTFTLIR